MAYKRKEAENMEGLLTNGKKKFVKYDEGAAKWPGFPREWIQKEQWRNHQQNEFEEGKPCSEAYKRVYESNRRLCEWLGVDEDPDVESIINYMFDITRTVAEKMFAYGAALGEN